jgi:hypothetical protein
MMKLIRHGLVLRQELIERLLAQIEASLPVKRR